MNIAKEFAHGIRHLRADASLLAVAVVWGITFVTVKNALVDIRPHWFLTIRFFIASAVLFLFYWKRILAADKTCWKVAGALGLFLFGGYALQTMGLAYTTASNAGFITGLSVVLVPLLGALSDRELPPMPTLLGAFGSAIGLGLLSVTPEFTLNIGDVLVLGCAVCFAVHIILVGKYAKRFDPVPMATVQLLVVGLTSGVIAALSEPFPLRFTIEVWTALIITAIPATAIAFVVQNAMQRFTNPTKTAVIFSTEPVFAGFAGYFFLNEMLTIRQLWGCGIILISMLASELYARQREE